MTKFLSFVVSRAVRKLAPVAVCLAVFAGFSSVPAQAGITYVCAANVDATQAGTCNYLNTVIAGLYSSAFSNANAIIFIQMGTTGLGESTSGFFNEVSYSSYLTALTDEGGTGTVRADAIASLNANATSAYASDDVEVTSALGNALGLAGMVGTTSGGTACFTPGTGSCYNGIITITTPANLDSESGDTQFLYWDQTGGTQPSDAYDFYSVVEHETDEVLGTASCISTTSTDLEDGCDGAAHNGQTGNPAAVDLFRYDGSGTLALNSTCVGLSSCPSANAYFSFNGGLTNGVPNGNLYNTVANSDDYADFDAFPCGTGPYNVQDGTACPGTHPWINSDGGAEINILDAVGFNLNAGVPEPGTLALLGGGLVMLFSVYRRRKRAT